MHRRALTSLLAIVVAGLASAPAHAAGFRRQLDVRMDDGVRIHGVMDGQLPEQARPLIIEFTPYALNGSSSTAFAGPAYNRLTFQVRGTGRSQGRWDLMGDREQRDIQQVLRWACHQPFSNGRIAFYGASASAIAAYNAMRRPLPCVKTAVLVAGTADMYRDIAFPGGQMAVSIGAVLLGLVAEPWAADVQDHLQRDPAAITDTIAGFAGVATTLLQHTSEDPYWQQRAFANPIGAGGRVPMLGVTSFYDIQPRGPFEAYMATRRLGSHLLVIGAHDGYIKGIDKPELTYKAWYDHYLLGTRNGIDRKPSLQLYAGRGSSEQLHAGNWVKVYANRWPVPGTRWRALYFDTARSGTAHSLNDGALTTSPAPHELTQSYPAVTSQPGAADPYFTGLLTLVGLGAVLKPFPSLTQMDYVEPTSLSYTAPPLDEPLLAVGPAALDLYAATTNTDTDLTAVIADVWPDGTAHPVGAGRLNSAYPGVDRARSLRDPATGALVQPYGIYARRTAIRPGTMTAYHVEFWPLGNEFGKGHRLRVYLVGASASQHPAVPAVNSIGVGGAQASRLLLPVLSPRR